MWDNYETWCFVILKHSPETPSKAKKKHLLWKVQEIHCVCTQLEIQFWHIYKAQLNRNRVYILKKVHDGKSTKESVNKKMWAWRKMPDLSLQDQEFYFFSPCLRVTIIYPQVGPPIVLNRLGLSERRRQFLNPSQSKNINKYIKGREDSGKLKRRTKNK